MGTQAVSLIWKDHKNNMINELRELFSKESFLDVTLVCCDGFSLKANKTVLSANSSFFCELFLANPCQHPVIVMTDIDNVVLKSIVEFMYKGEIDVSWETLAHVLKAGKRFKIKGIMSISQNIRRSVEKHNAALLSSSNSTTDVPTPNNTNAVEENQNASLESNLNCEETSTIEANSEHSLQKKQDSLNVISQEEFPQPSFISEIGNSFISPAESVIEAVTTLPNEESLPIPQCNEIAYNACSTLDVSGTTMNDGRLSASHEVINSNTPSLQSNVPDVEREIEVTVVSKSIPFPFESRYICHICNKFCPSKSRLEAHMRVHTGERPYCCAQCGKHFSDKSSLRIHKRVHSGEKPYKCSICGNCFSVKSTLLRHASVHTGEKPFSCHICQNKYVCKSSLLLHIRTHHNGKRTFCCTFCNRYFFTKEVLKNHQLLEHYEKMVELDDITR